MGELRIISRSGEPFENRQEAGRLLAQQLDTYRGWRAVVLGIPRGGIVVARELADALQADMDLMLAHKLGSPGQPELAMGSVTEDGHLLLNEEVVAALGVDDAHIQQEKARQMAEIKRRTGLFRRARERVPLTGKTVIITDDGVATGATMRAGVIAARRRGAARVVVAVPVAPPDTAAALRTVADTVVCLATPEPFYGIGAFYADFHQIPDEEVLAALAAAASRGDGPAEGDH